MQLDVKIHLIILHSKIRKPVNHIFLHQTFFITINLQIIRFRWIIHKQVYAKNIEGGPISNLRLKKSTRNATWNFEYFFTDKKGGWVFCKNSLRNKTTRRNNNANNSLIGRRRKEIFRGTWDLNETPVVSDMRKSHHQERT